MPEALTDIVSKYQNILGQWVLTLACGHGRTVATKPKMKFVVCHVCADQNLRRWASERRHQ